MRQPPTLATKLLVPPTPQYLIIRRRLLDVLDTGAAGPLVLLCAPPGAGKTILLSSWLQTRGRTGTVAWLSLDDDDNDASRLAADLLSALRAAGAIRRGGALDRLRPPRGARADAFLALLVNGLAKLRTPLTIVIDDVHELTSPQASGMVDFLVRHAPQSCHLVLAGRADPPIAIERLRVSGALTELRSTDLAFDREETGRLCRQLDLGLRESEIDALWRRTEGWAAALRLAGLSLQSHGEPSRFVQELAGTDRAIADYLVAEVLAHAPAERRAFMLRTSIVDALTPELGDALTGMEGSAEILAGLQRSGAPLQIAGAVGPWYRYHPLFGELLRAHLHHAHPEEVPLLHRRAAHWYAENGHVKAAIGHALAGESFEQAGGLIEESWLELFIDGAALSVRDQIAKLPSEVVAAHSLLAAAFAGSRLQEGDLQSADRYLSLAQAAAGDQPGKQLEIALAAVALLRARLRLDPTQAQQQGRRLAELAGSPAQERWASLRSFALCNLGATLLWSGRPEAAMPHLHEALSLARECGCEHTELDCQAQLAIAGLLEGNIAHAEQAASEALALSERRGWEQGEAAACAYLAAGSIAYWRGEIERAEGLAGQAVSAAKGATQAVVLAGRALGAQALAAGGPQSAAEAMVKLDAVRAAIASHARIPTFVLAGIEDAHARVSLAAGETELARSLLDAARPRLPECSVLVVREAQAAVQAGDPALARELLSDAIDRTGASCCQNMGPRDAPPLEAWLLLALLEQEHGEREAAVQALEHALELAEPERVCGPFLIGGAATRELLERQAQAGTEHPALLEILLDALGGRPREAQAVSLAAPLTERELKILRYLPTMLSNAEIGAETFVSLNTVKTHLRSIYRKLDASNRADAVQRARALGLLPRGIRRPRVVQRP
jgi:LuxR family maltose regulon positive regulatory protein